jgi:hypothetical protein
MQTATPMRPAQQFQRLTLERVVPARDGHMLWVAVEVVVMGSVSSVPSTPSITDGWCALSSIVSRTGASCG